MTDKLIKDVMAMNKHFNLEYIIIIANIDILFYATTKPSKSGILLSRVYIFKPGMCLVSYFSLEVNTYVCVSTS